jgi:hypothetical protein
MKLKRRKVETAKEALNPKFVTGYEAKKEEGGNSEGDVREQIAVLEGELNAFDSKSRARILALENGEGGSGRRGSSVSGSLGSTSGGGRPSTAGNDGRDQDRR